MATLSKRTRELVIDAILAHAPKKGRGARKRELLRGSDTLLLLEYRDWVNPNLPPSLYEAFADIGEKNK